MAQLLIYENSVPVSFARHGKWAIEPSKDYSFSRSVNSVPLMAVEILSAAAEYPVVFGGTGETVMPSVILGLRADENLLVDEAGNWRGNYIPAFVRRYPFVFSSTDEGQTFTLCIDESHKGINRDGQGEALFTEDRKPSPYVENVLKFLQQYQLEFARTQALCKKLQELNLLEPMQAQVQLPSGERMALTGFSVIDRARLKTLSASVMAELVKSDEMELIYAHLASMRNFAGMKDRVAGAAPAAGGSKESAVSA
jgi:hypothetical protein